MNGQFQTANATLDWKKVPDTQRKRVISLLGQMVQRQMQAGITWGGNVNDCRTKKDLNTTKAV